MSFTGELTLTEMPLSWQTWRLEQNLTFESAYGAVMVPAGFCTDGASIPRPLWWFLPAWGRYSRAAVVHDFLCWQLGNGVSSAVAPTRRIADAIFFEAMVYCGVNITTRWLIWFSVRLYAITARK